MQFKHGMRERLREIGEREVETWNLDMNIIKMETLYC